MKTKQIGKRTIAAGLCALVLCSLTPTSPYANSAQKRWDGVDATGAMISGEDTSDSPIIVEKEVLTFDIPEFPQEYYREQEDYLSYGGKVTAEYTFYNPSEYTVTAKLLFPFGNEPDYAYNYNHETDQRVSNIDTEKFDILVNGEAVEKKIRYSLTYPYSQFELERDLALLHDGFREDAFYSPDTTVTMYIYRINNVDTETYRAANIAFDVKQGDESRKFYFVNQSGFHTQKDGDIRLSSWVENGPDGAKAILYVIGEPLDVQPEWKLYQDGGVEDGEEIPGTVSYDSAVTETMTLYDFALQNWSEETGVSETDWYNAVIAEMTEDGAHYKNGILTLERFRQGLERSLMRWYEYEITLAPEERIVNTVTAPMYPGIDLTYEPPVYKYTYLLSPAKTWRAFMELEIYINTSYYLTETTVDGFKQYSDGYLVFLDGLPTQELEFTLSSESNPKGPGGNAGTSGKTLRTLILLCAGVICIAGTFGNLLSKGRKKDES